LPQTPDALCFFVVYNGLLDYFLSKPDFKWLTNGIADNTPLLKKTDEIATSYEKYKNKSA
jgi:hypothetical protein